MKYSLIHHQTENTNLSEFHSYICNSQKNEAPHFHKNFEIMVVMEGSCKIYIADREYVLNKGQAAFIMPFQIHNFTITEGALIRCTTLCEALILTLSRALDGTLPETPVFTPTGATYDYFCGQIHALFGENSGMLKRITPPSRRIKVKGVLYSIESEFLEQVKLHKIKDTENLTMTVLRYIADNFRNDISLHDIAANTGYNYQYLSRTFNSMLGINFKKLLNQYRMEYAYYAIQDTDLPITVIALDSGFQSIRSFNRVCLEIFGCSPRELRKAERNIYFTANLNTSFLN